MRACETSGHSPKLLRLGSWRPNVFNIMRPPMVDASFSRYLFFGAS